MSLLDERVDLGALVHSVTAFVTPEARRLTPFPEPLVDSRERLMRRWVPNSVIVFEAGSLIHVGASRSDRGFQIPFT